MALDKPLKRKLVDVSLFDRKEIECALVEVAKLLDLPTNGQGNVSISILRGYLRSLKATNIESREPSGDSKLQMSMAEIPLGMQSTGQDKIDDIGKIIRLKYIAQAKVVQDHVNARISKVQNLTADPKTNLKLAQVGF
uniref:DEK_C domain-containing protein n=1 Tax=Rhabditophanes sp. KR3021 TaxID=114890 RepID=A0AC35UEU0_9BILA